MEGSMLTETGSTLRGAVVPAGGTDGWKRASAYMSGTKREASETVCTSGRAPFAGRRGLWTALGEK